MDSLVIGILAGLAAIVIAVIARVANKPDRPAAERSLALKILNVVAVIAALHISIAVCVWAIWELGTAVMGLGLLDEAPATWVFWTACGVADLVSAASLMLLGVLTIVVGAVGAERRARWGRFHSAFTLVPVVAGLFQIALSTVLFLV